MGKIESSKDTHRWIRASFRDKVYFLEELEFRKKDIEDALDLICSDTTFYKENTFEYSEKLLDAIAQKMDILEFDIKSAYEIFPL